MWSKWKWSSEEVCMNGPSVQKYFWLALQIKFQLNLFGRRIPVVVTDRWIYPPYIWFLK